jgi:alpha-D-xyloside xylohydrolase
MVRVVYGPPGAYFSRSSLMTVPGACSQTAFEVKTSRESVFVTTSRLSARIALSRGEVSWTGTSQDGGRRIDAPAPYEALPVYVKAGSIVPMGPEVQYTAEKPADPLTVWVYTGQDASFELYEDDGVSYEYEKGAFSTIPMRWDERAGALTLGECTGSFPGMLRTREVRVVFVSKGAAVPHSATPSAARTVRYDGRPVVLEARP